MFKRKKEFYHNVIRCVCSASHKRQEGTREVSAAVRHVFLVQVENFDGDSVVGKTNSRGWGGKEESL